VKYLLDTGVFLLGRAAPNRLNQRARELLAHERSGLYLSAASSWEISIKFATERLQLAEAPAKYVLAAMGAWGIAALDVTHLHAFAAGELPLHHQDPFDRMLIAQARLEGMTLLTTDRVFEKYDVDMVWCGR
jgi:PIN domain nuclease of toxin-antitoxin system